MKSKNFDIEADRERIRVLVEKNPDPESGF